MIQTLKVMLLPNNKQKSSLFGCAGTARFAFNWALAYEKDNYSKGGKFLSDGELRKLLTQLKNTDEFNSSKAKRNPNHLFMWILIRYNSLTLI
jgi:putative transposase